MLLLGSYENVFSDARTEYDGFILIVDFDGEVLVELGIIGYRKICFGV